MTIIYDWHTTNYRPAAVHATLIVQATVYNKPLAFNLSLKNRFTFFFKFPGQFHIFLDAGTKYQNLGLSGTIRDVCLTLSQTSPGFYVSAVQVF